MDNWLPFAILAPAIYSINNFIDKLVIQKYIKEYYAIPIFTSIVALPFALIFWTFNGFPILSFNDSLLILISGMLLLSGGVLYFKALSKEETSLIIIMIQMTPVITLLLSYFFLQEQISLKQFLGFSLILTASLGASIKRVKDKFKISEELFYILAADTIWAIGYIVFDIVAPNNSFNALIAYESLGVAIGGLFLYFLIPIVKKSFNITLKKINKAGLGFVFTNEFLYLMGRISTYYAVALGPVALVAIVGSTQVFFGIILGIILTLFMPKVFKEDLSKEGLLKKSLFGLVVFIGIILIE